MNAFKTLLITALIGLSIVTPSGARPSKEEKMKVNAVELYESVAPHLVNNKGGAVDSKTVLNKPYTIFYWSAHWCGPCRNFTPKLVEFYKENGGGEKFEIILVSQDKSEEKMKQYMKQVKMPWYAINYPTKREAGMKKFGGDGIPNLMLIDREGNQLERGQSAVINKLKELLAEK